MVAPVLAFANSVATTLYWPSTKLLTRQTPPPIWTTKYLVAMQYTTHTTETTKRLYTHVQNEVWQERWHLVRRTVWAASIVLPIIDAVAWLFRQLAMIDPAIRQHFQLEEQRESVFKRERQFRALGDSVREFASLVLAIGYKQEADEGMSNEELQRQREVALQNFRAHFAHSDPHFALKSATAAILALYERCAIDHKPILEAFQAIDGYLKEHHSYDWLKDEQDSPLHKAVSTLLANYEHFHHLCETS
ncbi:MAG: hypothetical protein JSR37_02295 [Verrucomicrobia bacterium]|nr:hypothetical protein [Verrucomicrobiota bacterium]MBS0636421.1 hypothetical protein [Verrucomicrobiota bacterium]